MSAVDLDPLRKGLRSVELTSRPSRDAANGLYQSLGFKLRETNCYRHDLGTTAGSFTRA